MLFGYHADTTTISVPMPPSLFTTPFTALSVRSLFADENSSLATLAFGWI